MKTILVDAVEAFVIEGEGVYKPMLDLLEQYPNRKIILTGANDEQFKKFGLDKMPYDVFTLKHNPEAVKSAQSIGITSCHYDSDKKDLVALRRFLDENVLGVQ